jgi:hypothetical protein
VTVAQAEPAVTATVALLHNKMSLQASRNNTMLLLRYHHTKAMANSQGLIRCFSVTECSCHMTRHTYVTSQLLPGRTKSRFPGHSFTLRHQGADTLSLSGSGHSNGRRLTAPCQWQCQCPSTAKFQSVKLSNSRTQALGILTLSQAPRPLTKTTSLPTPCRP